MYSPETYRHRLIDEKIESYLSATGAILIDGMRWCGKTTTGQSHCLADGIGGSWISLADSTTNFSNRRLAQARSLMWPATPVMLLTGPGFSF